MAQVFYDWLLTAVDDYGRFDARSAILRAEVFPLLLDMVRETDVERCLAACEKAGCVRLYTCDGKPYLEVLDFRQRMRAKKSKYPGPPADAGICHDIDMTMPTETETETENPPTPLRGAVSGSTEDPPGFLRFWASWPEKHFRKGNRAGCLRKWGRLGLEKIAGDVLAGLERWKGSRQWQKDNGDFIPAPLPWLNDRRWEASGVPAADPGGGADNGEFKAQFTAEMAEAAGVPFDPEGGAT